MTSKISFCARGWSERVLVHRNIFTMGRFQILRVGGFKSKNHTVLSHCLPMATFDLPTSPASPLLTAHVMFKVDPTVFEEVPTCVPWSLVGGHDTYTAGILDIVEIPSDAQNPHLLSLLKAIKTVIPHSMPPWAWWTSNGTPLKKGMWGEERFHTLILTGGSIPPTGAVFWSTCSNQEEAASRVEVYETETTFVQSLLIPDSPEEAGVKRRHSDVSSPGRPSKRSHVTSKCVFTTEGSDCDVSKDEGIECPSCKKQKHPDCLVPGEEGDEDYMCISCSTEGYETALSEFDQRIRDLEADGHSTPPVSLQEFEKEVFNVPSAKKCTVCDKSLPPSFEYRDALDAIMEMRRSPPVSVCFHQTPSCNNDHNDCSCPCISFGVAVEIAERAKVLIKDEQCEHECECDPGMRDRGWEQLSELVGFKVVAGENFTLDKAIEMGGFRSPP
jgi:hypothetical protein